MLHRFWTRAVLVLLTLRPAAGGHAVSPPESAAPAEFVSEVLPNGLRVSILPVPGNPVVATQVWYHVGSSHEDAGSRGLAHLFEHLMFGATSHYTKDAYARYHSAHGGDENAYTTPDETVYVSEIAPEHHPRVLEMEADRMANLVLSQENLDNERKIVTEELRLRTENDPQVRLLVAAQRALLGKHPYAFDPTGSKEDLASATLESCKRFYEAYYRPDNAQLVIVGPVDGEATLDAVRRLFGPIPPGGITPPETPLLYGWSYPEEVALTEDLPPVEAAVIGFPLPPPNSQDTPALSVMIQLLSGGTVNPFREEIVTRRRKALQAGTEVLELRRGGAIVFHSASLPYRRRSTAFRLMEETRARLSHLDWLTEDTLASAKRSLLRKEIPAVYYAATRAADIGRARWWEGDERSAFGRAGRIAAVDREQVATVYRKYVGEAKPIRLYISPQHVPLLVRLFGWMYPLVAR